MATKKPEGIPLSALIKGDGFKRNYDIEFKTALDADLQRNAVAGIKHNDRQRERAKRPRGVGTDGRTMRELIAAEARSHDGLTPLELLPHVNSAAIANGMKPITLKTLRNTLASK
jgi:hypothetical protein